MTRNEAVRAQIRVMMADGARSPDEARQPAKPALSPVAGAPDRQLEASRSRHPAGVGDRGSPGRGPMPSRIERLTAVAEAAERYRKAALKDRAHKDRAQKDRKHRGKKARKAKKIARKELFNSLAAWNESEAGY